MKRTALSLMILAMVFGAFALDVDARGRGRSASSNRSSYSRSSNSGSRQRYQSRSTRSPQRSTSRRSNVRTTRNITRPRTMNSTPKPRTMTQTRRPTNTRPVGTVRPGTMTPRPNRPGTIRPRPRPRPVNNSAPKPRPQIKPLDPGIGNGQPAGGGVFTRPVGTVRPGTIRPRPNRPGTIRPRPRPVNNTAPKPRPGTVRPKPVPRPGTVRPRPNRPGTIKPRPNRPGTIRPRPRPRPPVGNGPPKPRPPKPMPGNGHGNGNGHGHGGHGHGHHRPWHVGHPRHSWWWFNFCTPLQNCAPADFNRCDFVYPVADFQVPGGAIIEDVRWYLGVKGLMLPGKGIGIDSVEPNSPADLVGLVPGMVITKCNGIVITDDAVFGQVIAESGGVLEMELMEKIDGELLGTTIQMTRLSTASF